MVPLVNLAYYLLNMNVAGPIPGRNEKKQPLLAAWLWTRLGSGR
jgi:hypothetical protein